MKSTFNSYSFLPPLAEKYFSSPVTMFWMLIIITQILMGLSAVILPFQHTMILWLSLLVIIFSFVKPIFCYLLLLVSLFPQFSLTLFQVGTADIRLADPILFLALFVWLFTNLREKRFVVEKSVSSLPIFLLLAWVTLSLLWTPLIGRGIQHYLRIISGFLVYFMTINLIKEKRDYKLALNILIAALVIFSAVGIYELLVYKTGVSVQIIQRAIPGHKFKTGQLEFSGNHPLGLMLNLWIMILIPQYFTTESKRWKKFTFMAIIIMVLGIIATFSRKTWLGVLVGIIFLGMRRKRTMLLFGSLVFLGILFIFLSDYGALTQALYMKFLTYFDSPEAAISSRLVTWNVALELFTHSPIIGTGVGSFWSLGQTSGSPLVPMHNFYLYILVELGLIGLMLIIGLAGKVAFSLIEFSKRHADEKTRFIARGYMAGFLGMLIQGGFKTFGLYDRTVWLFLGWGVVFLRVFSSEDNKEMKLAEFPATIPDSTR